MHKVLDVYSVNEIDVKCTSLKMMYEHNGEHIILFYNLVEQHIKLKYVTYFQIN